MPFSFNLSSGNYLSTQDVEVLQRATRDHQMERLTIEKDRFLFAIRVLWTLLL